jgi:hypothetical protein
MKIAIDALNVLNFLEGKEETIKTILQTEERYITIFDYSLLLSGVYNTENQSHNLYIIKKFIKENLDILEYTVKEAEIFAKLKIKYKNLENMSLMNASIIINNKIKYYTASLIYYEIKELKKFLF